MSIETLTLPQPLDADGDDAWVHFFCRCDPDVAVCGADVSAEEVLPGDWPSEDDCPLCAALDEANGGLCVGCGR